MARKRKKKKEKMSPLAIGAVIVSVGAVAAAAWYVMRKPKQTAIASEYERRKQELLSAIS